MRKTKLIDFEINVGAGPLIYWRPDSNTFVGRTRKRLVFCFAFKHATARDEPTRKNRVLRGRGRRDGLVLPARILARVNYTLDPGTHWVYDCGERGGRAVHQSRRAGSAGVGHGDAVTMVIIGERERSSANTITPLFTPRWGPLDAPPARIHAEPDARECTGYRKRRERVQRVVFVGPQSTGANVKSIIFFFSVPPPKTLYCIYCSIAAPPLPPVVAVVATSLAADDLDDVYPYLFSRSLRLSVCVCLSLSHNSTSNALRSSGAMPLLLLFLFSYPAGAAAHRPRGAFRPDNNKIKRNNR